MTGANVSRVHETRGNWDRKERDDKCVLATHALLVLHLYAEGVRAAYLPFSFFTSGYLKGQAISPCERSISPSSRPGHVA